MATMAQSAVQAFPSPLFPHPGLSSSTAAALAPGECFGGNYQLRNHPVLDDLLYFLYGSDLFSIFSFKIVELASLGIPSCRAPHVPLIKQSRPSGAVLLPDIL